MLVDKLLRVYRKGVILNYKYLKEILKILSGDGYMKKIRRIIVGTISAIYLMLWLMRIDIPRNIFIISAWIILTSQAIDEWHRYKDTKKKIHLLIPISLLAIIIFSVLYFLF